MWFKITQCISLFLHLQIQTPAANTHASNFEPSLEHLDKKAIPTDTRFLRDMKNMAEDCADVNGTFPIDGGSIARADGLTARRIDSVDGGDGLPRNIQGLQAKMVLHGDCIAAESHRELGCELPVDRWRDDDVLLGGIVMEKGEYMAFVANAIESPPVAHLCPRRIRRGNLLRSRQLHDQLAEQHLRLCQLRHDAHHDQHPGPQPAPGLFSHERPPDPGQLGSLRGFRLGNAAIRRHHCRLHWPGPLGCGTISCLERSDEVCRSMVQCLDARDCHGNYYSGKSPRSGLGPGRHPVLGQYFK